jgi:L-rhamnose mutarotase
MPRRYCLTLDLKDDPALIAEYKRYHQKIWPEITKSIRDSGIENMEIYLHGARMFMIMDASANFAFDKKAELDRSNPRYRSGRSSCGSFNVPCRRQNQVRNGC